MQRDGNVVTSGGTAEEVPSLASGQSGWLLMGCLGALAASAFLGRIRFVPFVPNNIGPFEVVVLLSVVGGIWASWQRRRTPASHSVLLGLALLIPSAGFSLLRVSTDNLWFCVAQFGVLFFGILLVWACYDAIVREPRYLTWFLGLFTVSAGVYCLWFLGDQLVQGAVDAAGGSFRQRAQAGIYMFTALWMVLAGAMHPDTSSRQRLWTFGVVVPLLLVTIFLAGRRSVYIGLLCASLSGLIGAILLPRRKRQVVLLSAVTLAGVILAGLFIAFFSNYGGGEYVYDRLQSIQTVLPAFFASSSAEGYKDNFIVVQRTGALQALKDYPWFGMGWGAFAGSAYSVTGHEIHSTPLRFLAETGLVGFALYIAVMSRLWYGSLRLIFQTRGTAYQWTSLMLCAGMIGISISHLYNRAVTERTFWLFLAVYLAYETLTSIRIRPLAAPRTGIVEKATRVYEPA